MGFKNRDISVLYEYVGQITVAHSTDFHLSYVNYIDLFHFVQTFSHYIWLSYIEIYYLQLIEVIANHYYTYFSDI